MSYINVIGLPLTNLENSVSWKVRQVLRVFAYSCEEFNIINSNDIHLYPYDRDIDLFEYNEQRILLDDIIDFIEQDQENTLRITFEENSNMTEKVIFIRHVPSDTYFIEEEQNIVRKEQLETHVNVIDEFKEYCENNMSNYLFNSLVNEEDLASLILVNID